ncbi:universal stress protein [Candidatus Blastococcus massiliensis]|uniref:universal stress protein n=1 Tax=Candidatus Blastococcus massiliensis TaxID=1470358 RepID=UPI0004BA4E87|nr:universal stress protein [Candidatus Blastococcus massiliensis]
MSSAARSANAEPHAPVRSVESRHAGGGGEAAPLVLMGARRRAPWLLVEVDGSSEAHLALVWALREAARREATVVAVGVLPGSDGDLLDGPTRLPVAEIDALRDRLDAALCRAVAETGVRGRSRSAVLERPVFDALTAAVRGADLVVVGAEGKRLLRPALPRPRLRHVARGA